MTTRATTKRADDQWRHITHGVELAHGEIDGILVKRLERAWLPAPGLQRWASVYLFWCPGSGGRGRWRALARDHLTHPIDALVPLAPVRVRVSRTRAVPTIAYQASAEQPPPLHDAAALVFYEPPEPTPRRRRAAAKAAPGPNGAT